jgi:hypothetical protein
LGGRGRWISEFEASLVYRVSSRTARATQRNPVSKKTKKKKKKKKKEESEAGLREVTTMDCKILEASLHLGLLIGTAVSLLS